MIEERISLVDLSAESTHLYRPDVAVVRKAQDLPRTSNRGALATLEPVTIPLALEDLDEIRQRWIEIRDSLTVLW